MAPTSIDGSLGPEKGSKHPGKPFDDLRLVETEVDVQAPDGVGSSEEGDSIDERAWRSARTAVGLPHLAGQTPVEIVSKRRAAGDDLGQRAVSGVEQATEVTRPSAHTALDDGSEDGGEPPVGISFVAWRDAPRESGVGVTEARREQLIAAREVPKHRRPSNTGAFGDCVDCRVGTVPEQRLHRSVGDDLLDTATSFFLDTHT